MLKIATKVRYGTRAMVDLAVNYGQGPVFLKAIAQRQEVSEGYLEHIMPVLKAKGLITASRGARGGYELSYLPSQITLADIVEAIAGNCAVVECVVVPHQCKRASFCVTRDVWEEISKKIRKTLQATTLEDMVSSHQQKLNQQPLMYSI